MSATGEGLTEPILYLRLWAQMQTGLATQVEPAGFLHENWRVCDFLVKIFLS